MKFMDDGMDDGPTDILQLDESIKELIRTYKEMKFDSLVVISE